MECVSGVVVRKHKWPYLTRHNSKLNILTDGKEKRDAFRMHEYMLESIEIK